MRTEPILSSAAAGFGLLFEAAGLLRRERRLWLPAAVPVLLSLLAFSLAIALVVANAAALHDLAAGWLPALSADAWYEWIWIGPGRAVLAVVGWLLFLALAAAGLVVAYLVASLLAAPFHDTLALRVEQIRAGAARDETSGSVLGSVAEILRSLREELRRLLFFFSVVGPLAAVGFVVPGAQLLTGPLIVAFTIVFLPLDYASYTLDRRLLSFAEKRQWVLGRLPLMVGFGSAAFVTCLLPGVNFLAMPLLVVAGTLLCLREPPRPSERAAGP